MKFDEVTAQLVALGVEGGSWDAIEETMTLPRLRALKEYWAQYPPVSIILAHRYKVAKPKKRGEVIRGKALIDFIKRMGSVRG